MRAVWFVCLMVCATPAGAQWLNHRTPGLPRTADGKVKLTAPAPRTADGKPDFTGIWTPSGGQGALDGLETLRVDPDAIKPWARDVIRARAAGLLQEPSRLPVPSQRPRSRELRTREAHPADAGDDRDPQSQSDVSTDLSRRPHARKGSGADVDGVFRRPLRRRRAGRGEQRLQRPHVAEQRRPSAHREAARHGALHAPGSRSPQRGRDVHRSRHLRQAVAVLAGDATGDRYRDARRSVREQDGILDRQHLGSAEVGRAGCPKTC